jgi:hypothetical protein
MVMALYAGTALTMSIDQPGHEPDISETDIPENVSRAFGDKFLTVQERKRFTSISRKAAKHEFDIDHMYTFHTYDDLIDYG